MTKRQETAQMIERIIKQSPANLGEIAEEIGCSTNTIRRYISGESSPTIERAGEIAEACGAKFFVGFNIPELNLESSEEE